MTRFALTQHQQRPSYARKQLLAAAAIAAALASATMPTTAQAQNSRILAGVAGGFAGGMIVGGALAPRPQYYGPGYYAAPAAVYYDAPVAHCYWTHGAPVWDPYSGVYRRPSIRVCD